MTRAKTQAGSGCTLLLVRHAHTAMARTFCGLSDPPLDGQGIAQLDGLQQKLEPYRITHIFSSNLQRARQTAESIALRCGLQVRYLDFLHELAFGSWEGLDWDQIVARDPEYAQRWLDFYPSVPAPGGEYFEHFLQRIQHAMTSIAVQVEDGCAVVVTHAGVIRTFLADIAQPRGTVFDPAACDYTSCWEVGRKAGQWHLPRQAAPDEAKVTTQPARVGY
jgi:broad specificity phosphatase PhoE